jgi:hypothetical protein
MSQDPKPDYEAPEVEQVETTDTPSVTPPPETTAATPAICG